MRINSIIHLIMWWFKTKTLNQYFSTKMLLLATVLLWRHFLIIPHTWCICSLHISCTYIFILCDNKSLFSLPTATNANASLLSPILLPSARHLVQPLTRHCSPAHSIASSVPFLHYSNLELHTLPQWISKFVCLPGFLEFGTWQSYCRAREAITQSIYSLWESGCSNAQGRLTRVIMCLNSFSEVFGCLNSAGISGVL